MHSLPVDSIGQMGCLDPPFLQWQVLLLSRLTPIRYSGMYVRGRHRESRVKWKHQADLSINFALQVTVFTFIKEAERAPSRLTMSLQSSIDQWHVIVQKKKHPHFSSLHDANQQKLNTVLTTQRAPPPSPPNPTPTKNSKNPGSSPNKTPIAPSSIVTITSTPSFPIGNTNPCGHPPSVACTRFIAAGFPVTTPGIPANSTSFPKKTPTYSPRNSTPASDPTPPPTATRPPPLQAARRA